MNTQENLFGYYRDKIEQRYIIGAIFLGLLCGFLIGEPFNEEYHWLIRGMQKALVYLSGALAILLILRNQSLLTHLDARYPDSLQRFEDYVRRDGNRGLFLKQKLVSILIVYTVLLLLSIFFLKDKSTAGMILSMIVLFPLIALFQRRMGNEDRKILKELKEKLSPNTSQ